jgi:two-component system, NtrC family, sensor histidine kinase HydH
LFNCAARLGPIIEVRFHHYIATLYLAEQYVSSTRPDDPSTADAVPSRVMEDMAQILAHRIRGLVMTIEGFTELLADTLPDRQQRELALRIFESASRIEHVLADLQTYAREQKPAFARTTLSWLLVELAAAIDEKHEARIDLVIPSENAHLFVDTGLIRQALLVLVVNALEATAPSGHVHIGTEMTSEGRILFHVENDGVVNDRVAESAFQPFFTTKAHNLGVGLNLAQRIARVHGGDVFLSRNDVDGGTCFTLDLPGLGVEDDAR